MSGFAISAADVEQAAATIEDDIVHTRSAHSRTLSEITGTHVTVKFENEQFTGSFKDRGAANHLKTLPANQREQGVVAMSAGNHAQGVAYHAGRLGIPATIVMPTSAPFSKVSHTAAHGANVVQDGDTLADAYDAAHQIASDTGASWLHPYDDAAVMAGQGSLAVELLADHPETDTIAVPIGGGGLISGIATYAKARNPDIRIIGVQSETYPGMAAALRGEPIAPSPDATLADGIAVKAPGELTLPIVEALIDHIVVVPESAIEQAVALYAEVEKTVAEGAGAATLAALLHEPETFAGSRVAIVLSGGNIDTRVLASVLMRQLVTTGRIHHLRITVPDLPGQLAPLVNTIGAAGANIVDIDHRRLFDPISARSTNIDVVLETRDDAHAANLVQQLTDQGYHVMLEEA